MIGKTIGFRERARDFIENEKGFHLGFIPSESANPRTTALDRDFRESAAKGLDSLFSCDAALPPFLSAALASDEFKSLAQAVKTAIDRGNRLILSGCGATGRIAILMEAMWRDLKPGDGRVVAMMTGGDLALVRAVEHFEDYTEVGARQVADLGVGKGDVLVGITATGETASIVGSAIEAAQRGASVFMVICVPKEIPQSRLDRCRRLYSTPGVTVVSMPIGGMALTGSTRMQSSTIEMLIVCAAMETALGADASGYPDAMTGLVASLRSRAGEAALGGYVDFEAAASKRCTLIDYVPGDYILDVLNDTTERSPTFRVPPFVPRGESSRPQPWAFARDLAHPTAEAWRRCFRREPRCLEWTIGDYEDLGLVAELAAKGVPRIGCAELEAISIGNEPLKERDGALQVGIGLDAESGELAFDTPEGRFAVKCECRDTPLGVFRHVAVKLAMNAISTGVMVKLGRVRGNYMTWLNLSNKKLVDRATRIVSELCHVDYETACVELFRSMEMLSGDRGMPVVDFTVDRLSGKIKG